MTSLMIISLINSYNTINEYYIKLTFWWMRKIIVLFTQSKSLLDLFLHQILRIWSYFNNGLFMLLLVLHSLITSKITFWFIFLNNLKLVHLPFLRIPHHFLVLYQILHFGLLLSQILQFETLAQQYLQYRFSF